MREDDSAGYQHGHPDEDGHRFTVKGRYDKNGARISDKMDGSTMSDEE